MSATPMTAKPVGINLLAAIRPVVRFLLLLSTIVLAITGLGGEFLYDEVEGYGLLLHMMAGGVFSVCLPLVALTFAARLVRETSLLVASVAWILFAAALTSLGTIVFTMMPWFGTDVMETLLETHEWSGKVLVIAGVVLGLMILVAGRKPAAGK